MRFILLTLVLLSVAACDTTASLRKLKAVEPKGTEFQKILSELYRDYAEQEKAAYDWWSSKYFADKGLLIAYGNDVGPEMPESWNVPKEEQADVAMAREKLMERLSDNAKQANPEYAAKLQFTYDCWLEQLEEGWQADDIDQCRSQFFDLLESSASYDGPPIGGPISTSYLLYFPFDSDHLDPTGSDGLEGIAQQVLAEDGAEIVIHGHADRSGTDEYNLSLSLERAEFIRKFMMEYGISEDRIQYYAFGESDPRVPTADGVRERANRRVEIFIE
ncbi:MAG: OmpA family protein [Rickettsiales bacterium]|nr:OmpA family protein [Rickettsiales bacterium]